MNNKILSNRTNSITLKAIVIAVLTLMMLIPINMVESLISERASNKETVQEDISSKWGGKQKLTGPILVLPYKQIKKNKDGEEISNNTYYAYFLPQKLDINGSLDPEKRSRSVYDVLCYQSSMQISGTFQFPDIEKLKLKEDEIIWSDAFTIIGISHLQGIRNQLTFNWDNQSKEILSSVTKNDVIKSGLTVKTPIDPKSPKPYEFSFDLALNGTQGIYFTPVGEQTHIQMKSPWKSATFVGDFLPNTRKIDQNGFDAEWNILDYNRNYPQMWTGSVEELDNSSLGVDLLLPVDQYQQTMRSIKYAVMFIALTFLVFFLIEIISNKRVHPIQYSLVSFALILFYCLLLSLSEYIDFSLSYLISAFAIVALITAYSYSIFKSIKQTAFMCIFFSILYIFLYVILQLEDMALLFGTIGLFIALATIMYVSRKVNWYKKEDELKENINPTPPPYNQQHTSSENEKDSDDI